jgi:hypothetical protein
MDLTIASLILSALAIVIALFAMFRRQPAGQEGEKFNGTPLRLQAYERLVLLTERIALPNLISRLNQAGISAVEMKMILLENIRHEFDYNSTQQLYVSPVSWDAVRNLKEQNIMLVNQVAASLADSASGNELNKKILELLMKEPNGALHELVLQTLNFEAKKLMK